MDGGPLAGEDERALHALVERCTDVFAHLSEDLKIDYVSPSITSLLGWGAEEVLGVAVTRFIHPDDARAVLSALERVRSGEAAVVRGRVERNDGSYSWLEICGGRLRGPSGEAGYFAALRDINEQVRLEGRYRLLVEAVADVVANADVNGVIQWVSPSVTAMLGWTPAELVGRRVFELIHPDDLQPVLALERDVQTGIPVTREARIRKKDGTYRWVSSTVRGIADGEGNEVGRVAAWRDIEDAHRAHEALVLSESRLRRTLDSLLDPHVLLTAVRAKEGHIVDFVFADANQAACDFNKLSREQLIGMRLLAQHPEGAGAELLAMYARVVETGEPLSLDNWSYPFEPGGSKEGVYDVRATKVGDGLVRTWRDVTDRREAERKLAEKEAQLYEARKLEAVGILAGGMAHQFNNRLATILGAADLLIEDPAVAGTGAPRYLQLIKQEAERAAGLTEGMLNLAQKDMVRLSVSSINDLVGGAESALRSALGEKAELVMSLSHDAGQVTIEPRQLRLLLEHLGTNARDAMPRGGRLLVATANVELEASRADALQVDQGAYVLLAVSDTGTGMDQSAMAHLFEPFFSTKGVGEGIGLGLAVVRGIVRQGGGGISITSEPGRGTTVHIYLPRVGDLGAGAEAPGRGH